MYDVIIHALRRLANRVNKCFHWLGFIIQTKYEILFSLLVTSGFWRSLSNRIQSLWLFKPTLHIFPATTHNTNNNKSVQLNKKISQAFIKMQIYDELIVLVCKLLYCLSTAY